MDKVEETPGGGVREAIDRLYRSHYGRLVAGLLMRFADLGLETVEDIVQDSFTVGLAVWVEEGIPANAAGWIYVVARNRCINRLKADRKRGIVADPEEQELATGIGREGAFTGLSVHTGAMGEDEWKEWAVEDDQLRLLFACAHPDLSPKVQVVITLKYVINLKMEAIARALGMTVDGIEKLLMRARKKIREEKIFLVEPGPAGLVRRLPIVHKIIYLIYNEGYKPAAGNVLRQEELCGEALMLSKFLLDSGLGDRSTAALHALMLFNGARFGARFGPAGELLDLEDQDRGLWSKPLIMMGCDFLRLAGGGGEAGRSGGGPGGEISTYHCEASIAWVHCTAKDWQSTDWPLIARLYKRLLDCGPNPFVELSYAIALFYAAEREAAFSILHGLLQMPIMNQYFLLNATLGKLYLLEGDCRRSGEFFMRALEQTELEAEKEFIRRKMGQIEGYKKDRPG